MDVHELIKRKGLLLGLSPRTINTYSYVLGKFLRIYRKPVIEITKNDIENFLLMKLENGSPGNTVNVYLNALIFFFEQVLNRKLTVNIRYNTVPQRLPEFLTQEECKLFFSQIKNNKHKLMVILMYSAGLRVSELLNLKVKDIEVNYGWVRQGKGNKDRVFILAHSIKQDLMLWIDNNKLIADDFIFNNHGNKMSPQTVRLIIKRAAEQSGISKNVHPHTLRHSFATHLLENGYAVTDVQPLLGHSKIETTLVYTHLARPRMLGVRSPLDELNLN